MCGEDQDPGSKKAYHKGRKLPLRVWAENPLNPSGLGLGFRAYNVGFRVWGVGCRVKTPRPYMQNTYTQSKVPDLNSPFSGQFRGSIVF